MKRLDKLVQVIIQSFFPLLATYTLREDSSRKYNHLCRKNVLSSILFFFCENLIVGFRVNICSPSNPLYEAALKVTYSLKI